MMAGSVTWLPDAPDTVTDLETFGSASPIRKVTEQVAFEGSWDVARRDKVRELFDGMAAEWSSRFSEERETTIIDALDRGGLRGPKVVELGAGSGLGTTEIAARTADLVALDLSMKMLREQSGGTPLVQGDASTLPIPDAAVDTLVLVNMFLFPVEVDRVLHRAGRLLWINTNGHETPIYLSPEDVVAALPGAWTATAGRAGTGIWAAVDRA